MIVKSFLKEKDDTWGKSEYKAYFKTKYVTIEVDKTKYSIRFYDNGDDEKPHRIINVSNSFKNNNKNRDNDKK